MIGLGYRALCRAGVFFFMLQVGASGLATPPKVSPAASQAPDGESLIYTSLSEQKSHLGRDNPMIHYIQAGWLMPTDLTPDQKAAFQQVARDGSAEGASPALLLALKQCQTAFNEFRLGTGLGRCKGSAGNPGEPVPSPCYPTMFEVPKALCIEGLYFESQNKPGDALRNYLDVLKFSRDVGICLPNATMFPVCVTSSQLAANRLRRLAAKGKLDGGELTTVTGEIRNWLAADITPRMILDAETTVALSTGARQASAARQVMDLHDLQVNYFETPYPERDLEAHKKAMKTFASNGAMVIPDLTQPETRYLVMLSIMRQATAVAEVEQYKLSRGKYPASLKDVDSEELTAANKDPFGSGEFHYVLSADRNGYEIYGVGPDAADQLATEVYDPSRGLTSTGDIVTTSSGWK